MANGGGKRSKHPRAEQGRLACTPLESLQAEVHLSQHRLLLRGAAAAAIDPIHPPAQAPQDESRRTGKLDAICQTEGFRMCFVTDSPPIRRPL